MGESVTEISFTGFAPLIQIWAGICLLFFYEGLLKKSPLDSTLKQIENLYNDFVSRYQDTKLSQVNDYSSHCVQIVHLIEFMELRIDINNRGKQFAGIGRNHLCDFQDGIQYQFPYPVRCGQLESIASDVTEECPDSFVCLKPLHRAKYVVLHHGQRKAGNLSREVHALALSEVEQLLAVVISHLGSPASSVRPVCLEETEGEVCCKQSVPLSLPATLREEQTDCGSSKLDVNRAVSALQCSVVLGKPFLLEFFDNLVSRQVTPLSVILGLAQLDHAQQMALDVTAGNQTNEVGTGKPAVNEQIVEADATLDGVLHHLDGLVGFLHGVLLDTFLNTLPCIVGREAFAALFVRQPLLLIGLPALLSVKREIKEQLAQSVTQQQSQALVAQDTLVLKMRENLADELTLATALRSVRIIDNQADRLVMRRFCATADFSEQLEVHRIEQLAPLNVTIIHKTIEHVFLTTEQAA